MEFIRLTDISGPYWPQAWELYERSFPLRELRSLEQHILAMDDPRFFAEVITDKEEFIGVIFYWKWDNYRFVEHFAIDPSLRGSGSGSRVLEEFLNNDQSLVMLEIEPLCDEISERREQFYERSGFTMNYYRHIHPSFRPSTEAHELLIMSAPRGLKPSEFEEFRRFTFGTILKYSDLDQSKLPQK